MSILAIAARVQAKPPMERECHAVHHAWNATRDRRNGQYVNANQDLAFLLRTRCWRNWSTASLSASMLLSENPPNVGVHWKRWSSGRCREGATGGAFRGSKGSVCYPTIVRRAYRSLILLRPAISFKLLSCPWCMLHLLEAVGGAHPPACLPSLACSLAHASPDGRWTGSLSPTLAILAQPSSLIS